MCAACMVALKQQGKQASCGECEHGVPALRMNNEFAIWFIHKLGGLNAIIDGFGGLNASAVEFGFKLLKVPEDFQSKLFRQIVQYVGHRLQPKEDKSKCLTDS
jgi:hypothetical protein